MPYNPFDKPIGEALTAADLQLLITRSVSEGYFVEYKGQMQPNDKIAKSIAAFANTYGGWYFIGVEADKTHNIATNICGLSLTTCPDPIAVIREVAKSRISPTPVFYPQVVDIAPDVVAVVVYVPGEQDTPFITSDGKIYRRIADSSNPEPETNRYAVDRLYDQQKQHAKQFQHFFRDSLALTSRNKAGWLVCVLSPYPSGLINKYSLIYPENVEKLFSQSQQPINLHFKEDFKIGYSTIDFTSIQLTNDSVMLRVVDPFNIAYNSLTLELFADGSAKFVIPFSYPESVHFLSGQGLEGLKSSSTKEALRRFLAKDAPLDHSIDGLRFFDVGQLWSTAFVLLNFYLDWLGKDLSLVPEIKFAFRLQDVYRHVPFIDMDEWGDHVKRFSLPILFSGTIQFPDEPHHGVIYPLDENGYDLWSHFAKDIGLACGLTSGLINAAILNSLLGIHNIPPDWLTNG
jgi:Putative DNA-binding domain